MKRAKEELKKLAQRKAALIVKQNQQAKAQEEAKREQAQFTQQNAGRPQTSQGAVAPAYTFAAMGHSGNVSALSKQIEKTGNEIKAVNASIDAIGKEFGKKMLASESSPTSKSGTAGAQIDTTTKKTKKGKTKKQKPARLLIPTILPLVNSHTTASKTWKKSNGHTKKTSMHSTRLLHRNVSRRNNTMPMCLRLISSIKTTYSPLRSRTRKKLITW